MTPTGASRGEILFHHPYPLVETPRAGSEIRPRRMIEAFRALGFEVIEVAGYSNERAPLMRSISRQIRSGRRFEFCYAESLTSPTALSDADHLPRHPIADPIFFRSLQRAAVPTGLYYRDIHWRFSQYRDAVALPTRLVAEAFYRFDLSWYSRFVDVVFLPDLGMAHSVPGAQRFNFSPLPPGTMATETEPNTSDGDGLELIYIGSVSPPHNDITPLLHAVAETPRTHLTLTCPAAEAAVMANYPKDLTADVTVVHLTSDEVDQIYKGADISCLVYSEHPYRDFAMPVKLFEAIGKLKPCITNADSAAGRFVEQHGIGWTYRTDDELRTLLARLVNDPTERESAMGRLVDLAPSQTWTARAESVASTLTGTTPMRTERP